jgi:hypothetical protein
VRQVNAIPIGFGCRQIVPPFEVEEKDGFQIFDPEEEFDEEDAD